MTNIARLSNEGELNIIGELNERVPLFKDNLIAHFPFDGTAKKYIPHKIRYIRDWLNGSTANVGNHWVELKAFDIEGNNVAFNKTVTANFTPSTGGSFTTLPALVNNITSTTPYIGNGSELSYMQVDLGNLYNLKLVQIWHFYLDARTYHNTKTEVSEDGIYWYPIFDSAIEGEYPETSIGKSINLINPTNSTCIPSVSNCTLTSNEIYVEESTTNLWHGDLIVYNNYNVPASLEQLTEKFMGQPIYREKMTVDDAHSSYLTHFQVTTHSHGVQGSGVTFLANNKYAVSIYWRPVNKKNITVSLTASNIGGWTNLWTTYVGNGWYRSVAYRDGTVATNKTDAVFFSFCCPSIELNEPIYIDWVCPQIEKGRTIATAYVNGSRIDDGILEIPISTLVVPYTIHFEFTPNIPNSYADSVNWILEHNPYRNDFIMWKRMTEDYYRIRITGLDFAFSNTDIIQNGRYKITLVADNGITKIYLNGVYKGTINNVANALNLITLGYAQGQNTGNNKFYFFSIYNKAFTDDEVYRMSNYKFSPDKNGNINANKLKEKIINIPDDVYYFPLSADTKDVTRLVEASDKTNLVFEDGAAWVGTPTTNIVTNPDLSTWSKSGGVITITKVLNHILGINFYKINTTLASITGGVTNSGIYKTLSDFVDGGSYEISFYAYSDIDGVDIEIGINTWQNETNHHFTLDKKTRRYSVIQSAESDVGYFAIKLMSTNNVYISCPQIVAKPFVSPYTPGTRNSSSLEFSLYTSIGLDWSKDWTICYWKKPIGTYSNNLNGYNIDSIGVYQNSVGGGYYFWGKSYNSNNITVSNIDLKPMVQSKYFNTWRFISLQKTGTTLTFTEWSPKEGKYVTVAPTTDTVPNYYVTQHGYDLKLGGWSNANPTNAYFRDLIVAKRYLTDTEVENIYKQKFSIRDNIINVPNIFREKIAL